MASRGPTAESNHPGPLAPVQIATDNMDPSADLKRALAHVRAGAGDGPPSLLGRVGADRVIESGRR